MCTLVNYEINVSQFILLWSFNSLMTNLFVETIAGWYILPVERDCQ